MCYLGIVMLNMLRSIDPADLDTNMNSTIIAKHMLLMKALLAAYDSWSLNITTFTRLETSPPAQKT